MTFGEEYARVFKDKDLSFSRIKEETNEDITMIATPTPTITTGQYGETTIEITPTPINFINCIFISDFIL